MIAFSTQSGAYRAGQDAGPFVDAAIFLVILWISTRDWRRPKPARIPEDLESTAQLARKRTRVVALWTVAAIAAAVVASVIQSRQP